MFGSKRNLILIVVIVVIAFALGGYFTLFSGDAKKEVNEANVLDFTVTPLDKSPLQQYRP